MTPTPAGAAAGALPGLWPHAPDAPFLVPVPGTAEVPDELRAAGITAEGLQPAYWIGRDRFYLTATRNGLPIAWPNVTHRGGEVVRNPGIPLAGVVTVRPGVISNLRKPVEMSVDDWLTPFVDKVLLDNGPAVFLTGQYEVFLPTPDPVGLAAEIERRRQGVIRFGGWTMPDAANPPDNLRGGGPIDGRPVYGMDAQPTFRRITALFAEPTWQPHTPAPIGSLRPVGEPPSAPRPPRNVPLPESVPDQVWNLGGANSGLQVMATVRRMVLGPAPLPRIPSLSLERFPPEPHPFMSVPLARLSVVRAGQLSGLPPRWAVRGLAPDTRTEIRLTMADGPAVWLWGPTHEWVIPVPDDEAANALVAGIRSRQEVGMLFPVALSSGPERSAWQLSELRPVDGPQGRALPPTPAYAPVEPTIVPPGTWQPTGGDSR
ncbi:hypothetical protein [Gandjariella thermophila]|uniref:Uncharacterized protein n=1 Tax=Gandjariella thermophila TaxID=1931992 RepID=A0A4D4J2H2_9PSEU|nr:hypothetical protein [Gandjariella thermophila]GDY29360.1 hypothetical protein GTS_09930 [Gandjariella thermophila]